MPNIVNAVILYSHWNIVNGQLKTPALQFPHLSNRDNVAYLTGSWPELDKILHRKPLAQFLTQSRYFTNKSFSNTPSLVYHSAKLFSRGMVVKGETDPNLEFCYAYCGAKASSSCSWELFRNSDFKTQPNLLNQNQMICVHIQIWALFQKTVPSSTYLSSLDNISKIPKQVYLDSLPSTFILRLRSLYSFPVIFSSRQEVEPFTQEDKPQCWCLTPAPCNPSVRRGIKCHIPDFHLVQGFLACSSVGHKDQFLVFL